MPLPTWEVDLNVYGPVSVQASVHLREPKGFSLPDPFQSDVRIKYFRGEFRLQQLPMLLTYRMQGR